MARGELLSDDLITELVVANVTSLDLRQGFVLDGFPRTVSQAQAVDGTQQGSEIRLDAVIWLDVSQDELFRRLMERGQRSGRSDDNAETIRHRFEVDANSSESLKRFYRQQGILVEITGSGEVAEVTRRILDELERCRPSFT